MVLLCFGESKLMLPLVRFVGTIAIVSSMNALSANAISVGALTLAVEGLRNLKGQVCVSVFNSSQGFPTQGANAVRQKCVKITDQQLTIQFDGLAPGTYAVAVLHDENSDGQANRNVLGIPNEGFGFSQNPRIVAGPPKFGDAAVLVAGRNTEVQIQLQYLLGR
jgi:uncharacterized protein (DUF2141 family)